MIYINNPNRQIPTQRKFSLEIKKHVIIENINILAVLFKITMTFLRLIIIRI
jgi:hypothetical protein